MSTKDKRPREEDPSGTGPAASMPRIETNPVEAAIQKAERAYPIGPERLEVVRESSCKLPPVPKAVMNGATVSFGSEEWIKLSAVAKECVLWGPSPDYSDSPGAKNVAKAKIEVGQEFIDWYTALWESILDAIVAANGGPNASKRVKAKLDAAKTVEEKRSVVIEAHKLHSALKDGIFTAKVKLIAEGEPGENDASAIKSFPPLTQEEFKRGCFQIVAKPMKALDGKTSIPLDRVLDSAQGRPIGVFQLRFELNIKSVITPDGGKRVCVIPTSVDFQLLSKKPSSDGATGAMVSIEDIGI